jgi:F-box-like
MLRSIQRSKEKIADSLQAQISDAQIAYDGAMERYRAHQLVLESLLSEIHTSKQFIDMLSKQKQAIDDEMSELRGLVHPIRQCPPEVLCHIFTMALTPIIPGDGIDEHRRQLQQTCRVMSVCRYWRDVAVGCPVLWSAVPVPLNRKSSDIQLFWNRAVGRVKNAPASICITHVGTDPQEGNNFNRHHQLCQVKLDVCDLRQFPVISKLRIQTLSSAEAAYALSLMTRFPVGKIDRLEFEGLGDTAMQPPRWWSFATFLKKFPPFTSLAVEDVSIPTQPDASQFHSVTRLRIGGDSEVSLAEFLLSFSNLEYLEVGRLCGLEGHGMTSEYEMTQLRYLSVEENWSFPWDAPIKAPNLTSLRLILKETDISSDCESFLASCSALTSAELTTGGHSLTSLSSATSWLLHLTLDVHEEMLGLFVNSEESEEIPPFPKLKTLTLVYPTTNRYNNVPAFWYFDDIVRDRCLPRSNIASQLIAPLLPLETLTIRQNPDLYATWKGSAHCATATTQMAVEGPEYSSVTLSWILSKEEVVALQAVSSFLFSQNSAPKLIHLGFRHKIMHRVAKLGPFPSVSSYFDDLGTSKWSIEL